MLGDSKEELAHYINCNGHNYRYNIPSLDQERSTILRSEFPERDMGNLAESKVTCLKENKLPIIEIIETEQSKSTVYEASDFGYFAASEEIRFLSYGSWDKECSVID